MLTVLSWWFLYSQMNMQSRKILMEQSKEIKRNWTRPKNFDICFCEIFGCYDQSFIAGRETGHQARSPANFEIFLIFPSFLRS